MKRSRLWSVKSLLLLLVFAASSCGRSGDRFESRTYRIPWPSAAGDLRLQDVEIRTLTDPQHFSGDAARILVEPGDGGSRLAGSEPQGRYVRTRSGVLIPADFVTMQAVTAYAHTERLRDLDESVGAGGVLSWPLSLGVEVRVMSYGQRATNNAIYDAKLDSLLLVPYDQGALPIALNPGVLAHEHFHFLFQRLVMSRVRDTATQTSCSAGMVPGSFPDSEKGAATIPEAAEAETESDEHVPTLAESFGDGDGFIAGPDRVAKTASAIPARVYNAYVLRGLNEGFADFYGWVYSGDESFLSKSLPEQDLTRRLDSDSGRLPSEKLLRRLLVDSFHPEKILSEPARAHGSYALGSIYARTLRRMVGDLASSGRTLEDARLLVARAMIATLPEIGAHMETSYESEFLSPNFVISRLLAHLPPLTAAVCASLDDVHAPEDSYAKPPECGVYDAKPPAASGGAPAPAVIPAPKRSEPASSGSVKSGVATAVSKAGKK